MLDLVEFQEKIAFGRISSECWIWLNSKRKSHLVEFQVNMLDLVEFQEKNHIQLNLKRKFIAFG